MKFLNAVFSAYLLLTPLAVRGADALPDYPAEKLSDRVWVIHGPTQLPNPDNKGFMNNPAFVLTDTGVVVVDPGSSVQTGEMVLRQIRKLTQKPVTHVLSTHIHGDHWLANQAIVEAYPDVKTIALSVADMMLGAN